jgi:hypothetical protein
MGLDQYAYVRTVRPEKDVDFDEEGEQEELYYWRKHANLQGWMEDLYRKKGGEKESFNCVPVLLTLEDIERLEETTKQDNMPHTTGFFFGESYPEDDLATLEFCKKARKAIQAGKFVFYSSWW